MRSPNKKNKIKHTTKSKHINFYGKRALDSRCSKGTSFMWKEYGLQKMLKYRHIMRITGNINGE